MEYKRRTRSTRRRGGKRHGSGGEVGRAVLALLMVGAIVYLVSASTAGTWIAKNVVVPVFSMVDDFRAERERSAASAEAAAQQEADAASMQVSLDDTRQAVDFDVTLPAISCYALQMGVFSSNANAQAQALALRGAGAGGYIMEDAGRYRVLSAAYTEQAQAASAKQAYIAQGVDCTIYPFSTEEATYRVSALEEQQEAVHAGFSAIAKAQQALCEAVSAYESGALDAAAGRAQLASIQETLESDMALLSAYEGEHAALAGLLDCYADCREAIKNAADAGVVSDAAFGANLKYAQLFLTDRYALLMQGLG